MKYEPNKILSRIFKLDLLIAIIIAFTAGFFIKGIISKEDSSTPQSATETRKQMWTCSMHPQIQLAKPGKCPICFMDLIPVADDEHSGHASATQISFSPDALKLMEVQTAPVERKFVEAQIRLVGKIDYNETKFEDVTAWVPGRIDRLYVDFTGTRVIGGDHMFYLYSPDLISAQAEFLQSLKAVEKINADSSALLRRSAQATLAAAQEKLKLLGLTDGQINDIKKSEKTTDHVTIYAPRDGIVIKKHVSEGAYVKTGTPIYTIADLSELWVILDAYESDMMWIRYGQEIEFSTEANPGQVFTGQITFISPTVDPKTRTIKLRVNVKNTKGKLKPEMFVRAVVRSKVAAGGFVADADIAGKWICPMHPSVIKNDQGICDICQMNLVKTNSLGYTEAVVPEQAPLVIPASAPLITGKRAIVYVRKEDTEKPTFEGREVILGPRAGDYYLIEEGLIEGENVVIKGNFKIDSALQIQAKPSMMNPDGLQTTPSAHHGAHTQDQQTTTDPQEQKLCPVMGGKINKEVFIEYKGKKVYFCCPGCETEFLKEPEKYIKKLPQFKHEND